MSLDKGTKVIALRNGLCGLKEGETYTIDSHWGGEIIIKEIKAGFLESAFKAIIPYWQVLHRVNDGSVYSGSMQWLISGTNRKKWYNIGHAKNAVRGKVDGEIWAFEEHVIIKSLGQVL